SRGNKLRRQSDACEFVHEPLRALPNFLFVLVIRRNAWETQERIIFLKVIVAHDKRLIGFSCLPTTSAGVEHASSTRPMLPRVQFRSLQTHGLWHARESK